MIREAAYPDAKGSAFDLPSYLADIGPALFTPAEPLSVVQEITALQHVLGKEKLYPVIHVPRVRLAEGSTSAHGVVTNLCASRDLMAKLLGLTDHRQSAVAFSNRTTQTVAPEFVSSSQAPAHDVVVEGDRVDLTRLPALRQHVFDVGHYVTAGHCTTCDVSGNADNTSIQRCWVKGPRLMTMFPYPGSHNARNVESHWARGEPCPVAVWIGHHPSVVIGAQVKLGHPESHWAAAGGVAGRPIRLVPSVTHGSRIMVPADAEFVIEGWIPPNRLEIDGPFAEYPGYVGVQIVTPVIEVTCVTHRRNALFHDFGGGLEDHLVPENMAMEGKVYSLVKPLAPSLINVHVPFSGRRFHAYLQFRDPPRGEVRDALTAALAYRRLRTVFAVDEDIDIFDDRSLLWAMATRVQWHRDTISVDGLSHGNLDPSLPVGATTVTKVAIDATLPPAPASGLPKPFAPINTVSDRALERARAVFKNTKAGSWPSA
jgi:2,5-furandicarboxylate decarboxylase 1